MVRFVGVGNKVILSHTRLGLGSNGSWLSRFERGVIQASRYRDGVHEAYLCVPRNGPLPDWLVTAARQNGVGLLQANPNTLTLDVRPEPPRPEP